MPAAPGLISPVQIRVWQGIRVIRDDDPDSVGKQVNIQLVRSTRPADDEALIQTVVWVS